MFTRIFHRSLTLTVFLGLALALALALASCGVAKTTLIGTKCAKDKDCNVPGQVCVVGVNGTPSICTHTCVGQTGDSGCPIGYDCGISDTTKGLTCNKVPYAFDANTGAPLLFGVSCAIMDSVCMGTSDPNSAPSCRKAADFSKTPVVAVKNDPSAFCTGVCQSNVDCPVNFECLKDYDDQKKCLKRRFCSECTIPDNCPLDFGACIPSKDGQSRYCTKTCIGDGDCGGAQNTFLSCGGATDVTGSQGRFCLHRYGACVGAGEICDPCRTKADCAKSNSSCFDNIATGEQMCSKVCTADTDCKSPNPTGCDNTVMNKSLGICNGDNTHMSPGLFSCYM